MWGKYYKPGDSTVTFLSPSRKSLILISGHVFTISKRSKRIATQFFHSCGVTKSGAGDVYKTTVIPPGDSSRALFGMVKTWPFGKVVGDLQRSGIKRSRLESSGRESFIHPRNSGVITFDLFGMVITWRLHPWPSLLKKGKNNGWFHPSRSVLLWRYIWPPLIRVINNPRLPIPGTPMTSIFEGQPPKTRPFPTKTRVNWVLGITSNDQLPYFYKSPAKHPQSSNVSRQSLALWRPCRCQKVAWRQRHLQSRPTLGSPSRGEEWSVAIHRYKADGERLT